KLRAAVPELEQWVAQARAALDGDQPLTPPPALPAHPFAASHQRPTVLYNAMLHPIVRFPVRGAIWYQGEANVGDGPLYVHRLQGMIHGWREAWDQPDMPVGIVLLAPYIYSNKPGALPLMWEAQAKVVA